MWHEGDPKLARAKKVQKIFAVVWISSGYGAMILSLFLHAGWGQFIGFATWTVPFLTVFWIGSIQDKVRERIREGLNAQRPYQLDLLLKQRGIFTGSDIGFAWFEDQYLHFRGNLCSFHLPNALTALDGGGTNNGYELKFISDAGNEVVLILRGSDLDLLANAITAWRNGPNAEGPGVMVPLTFEGRSKPGVLELPLLGFAFLVGFLGVYFRLHLGGKPQAFSKVLGFVFVCLGIGLTFATILEYRKKLAFERELLKDFRDLRPA